jgi:DNA-binding PadR family transcriptional regulator
MFVYINTNHLSTISDKQKLILYFLSLEPGIKDIYAMVNVYERADYPFQLGENLRALLELQYIQVAKFLDNGTPAIFELTEEGRAYLQEQVDTITLIDYIKTLQAPDFILGLAQSSLDRPHTS